MPEQTCASAITKRINDLQIVKNELLEAKYQLIAVADRIESWPRIVLYFVGIKKMNTCLNCVCVSNCTKKNFKKWAAL